MSHTLSVWLPVSAFFGAGVANAVGASSTRRSFMRWGYPAWWCRVTGALEIADAGLIALPGARLAGLVLGAMIVVTAILTLLRHREFSHLLPLSAFGRRDDGRRWNGRPDRFVIFSMPHHEADLL